MPRPELVLHFPDSTTTPTETFLVNYANPGGGFPSPDDTDHTEENKNFPRKEGVVFVHPSPSAKAGRQRFIHASRGNVSHLEGKDTLSVRPPFELPATQLPEEPQP